MDTEILKIEAQDTVAAPTGTLARIIKTDCWVLSKEPIKLNSTISFTEEIEYDFIVKNSRYEMEFRLLSNTKRFQICSGDMHGNGFNIMYNKLTKCKEKHQSDYWHNVYGEVKSMRVDDITII